LIGRVQVFISLHITITEGCEHGEQLQTALSNLPIPNLELLLKVRFIEFSLDPTWSRRIEEEP